MGKRDILRKIVHMIFRLRTFNNRCIGKFARQTHNKKILEVGSGKEVDGKYTYSAKDLFNRSNSFMQSDITKEYGHKVIDVTSMNYKQEFDIIICANVLEHVFEFHKAIENMYKALKSKGILIIFVPVFYPLHDEPHDYWRYTEHALKKLLAKFNEVKIKHSGIRSYPLGYYVEAKK